MSPARFSVNQIVLVNLLFVALIVAGILAARRLPLDVFPDISFNSAILITVWPGASPDDVERLLTTRIEEEIEDVAGIKDWFSFSIHGASEIQIEWDESLDEAQQQTAMNDLRAAVDRVDDLPEEVEQTIIKELSISEVFAVAIVAVRDVGGVGEFVLRDFARDLERAVERVPGVRKAQVRGRRDRELRVHVDKARAQQADVTLAEISDVIARNNQNVPGGVFSDSNRHEIRVRGIGNFASREQLAATVIKKSPEGNHVRLDDVADVVSSFERRHQFSRFQGDDTISLGVSKTSDADLSVVIGEVRSVLEEWRPRLPPGIEIDLVSDSSIYVNKRVEILRSNLALGIVSVIFILWFTVGYRNAMLAIVGVPFSFLTAMILFPMFDITINSLSLIGFVMVSGMLVDDAIIVLENIYRHIEEGVPVREAVINGTDEVMWPVISSVSTTMAAFIPMLMVTGTSGEFMSILPKTIIVCLAASLLEALVVLPAHYLDWGSRRRASDGSEIAVRGVARWSAAGRVRVDGWIATGRELYLRTQAVVLANRAPFLLMCAAAFFFSCGLSQHIPVNMFPNDFADLYITVESPRDFGLDETNQVVMEIEASLAELGDELTDVSAIVGEGMTAGEVPIFGSNYAVLFVTFPTSDANVANPDRMPSLVRDHLERHAQKRPGGIENLIVASFRNGPPVGKPVAIRVESDSYEIAKEIAAKLRAELSAIPGVLNIEDNVPLGPRELSVRLDEHRASIHGLTFRDVGAALRGANDGLIPSTFKDPTSDEDIDIRVMLAPDQRTSASDLLDVEIRTPAGYRVKLGDVSTVSLDRGYQRLYHYGGRRTVVVYADVDNQQATSDSVNGTMKARFADVSLNYPGVSLVFGGQFEEANEAFEDMGRTFIVALIAIYAILAAQFRSYAQPFIVMSVIALAYIGVVLGMWVWGYALSMYVVYAMVGLAGVVVNDSLVLIDFVNKERARGTAAAESVREASRKRYRAILLTTLTTIAGLLPMAMGIGGRSPIFGPFAAAIVVGLAVASFLTLFVVPALYLGLEDSIQWTRGLASRRTQASSGVGG